MNMYQPKRNTSLIKGFDWLMLFLYLLLVVMGWFSICGASFEFDSVGLFNPSGRPGSQLIWMGVSFVVIFIIMMLDKDFFDIYAYPIYIAVFILMILTILFAPEIKGSRSWLEIGSFRIQSAEFAKFATALALARLMSSYGFKLTAFRNIFWICVLIGIPMISIILQKETGTALVFFAFLFMLYREGMSGYVLLLGICAVTFFVVEIKYAEVLFAGATPMGEFAVMILIILVLLFILMDKRKEGRMNLYLFLVALVTTVIGYVIAIYYPFNLVWVLLGNLALITGYLIYSAMRAWQWRNILLVFFAIGSLAFLYSVNYVFEDILEPHQQIRIRVSLGLENDPTGASYNVNQSKIAIGSGGFMGKGFLNGTQTKLKYVPEQDTDFIFCTIGEEFGFVGSAFVLIVFALFIIRLIVLSERQTTVFGRIYGYCVASVFLFHLVINIGMTLGLTPVIGIPLPFFSYGGSSLLSFTILLFVFLRIDAARK